KLEGKPLPDSVLGDQRYAFIRRDAAVLGPRFRFARHGQAGIAVSEALPHTAAIVDKLCFVHSVHTDQFNHGPAQVFAQTGFAQPGRPALGAWTVYGLGCETRQLPAFVVLTPGKGLGGGAAPGRRGVPPPPRPQAR